MAADESGGGGGDARLSVYAHCATASCGSGGCKSGGCKSGGKSGGCKSGGESGGKSGGCKSCKRSNLVSGSLCALHVVQWPSALQGRYTRPPFNGAAAVKRLSASVSGGVFLRGSKQEQKIL